MPTSPSISTNGASLVYRFTVGTVSGEVPAVTLVNSDGGEVFGVGALSTQVQGNVASGVADTGNPVKSGGLASGAIPTTATAFQRVNLWLGLNGQTVIGGTTLTGADGSSNTLTQMTITAGGAGHQTTAGYVFNNTTWDRQRGDVNATVTRSALGSASLAYAGVTGGITTAASTPMFVAAGAGTRNFLHGIQWKNTSVVASEIVVLDGATVIWRGHASASMTMTDGYMFDPPLRGTANTAMNVQMVTTATATIVSAQGSTGA